MAAKVVFLDDSADLRSLIKVMLKTRAGVECLSLAHLSDLESHVAEVLDCSAAILDINLGPKEPGGLEAYKWLRQHGFKGKIIFLTGHAHSDPEVVRAAGLDVELMEKPFDAGSIGLNSKTSEWPAMNTFRELIKTHVSAPSAYFETAIAALINVTGFPLEIMVGQEIPTMPDWPAYASIAVGLLIFVTLVVYRRRPELNVAYVLFVVNALAVTCALVLRDPYYAKFASAWVPFQASKLGCLIAALLAPSFLTGIVAIAIHAFGAVVSYALIPQAVKQTMAVGEPFAVLAFGVAGVLTLTSRFRRIQIEHRLSQVKAHAHATERFARRIVRMRDLMNTPLQVIEFSVSILRGGSDAHSDAVKGLDNAMRRLNELNEMLKEHDRPTPPAPSR